MAGERRAVVVGGGASGLAAAIAAARDGAQVTVLEAAPHVGKPILATGNGRCNLTNTGVTAGAYNHPAFVAPALDRCGAREALEFFAELGLLTVEESEGRVYPLSRTAVSVVDVLRNACARLGVELRCDCRVQEVRASADGSGAMGGGAGLGSRSGSGSGGGRFRVRCEGGDSLDADAVVVATGGGSGLLAGIGHELVPFRPVLCSLATDTAPLRGLDGVRVHARVSAYRAGVPDPLATEPGEVLFRKYGVSGIVVFDLSRAVEAGDELSLDLLPGFGADEAAEFATGLLERMGEAAGARGASGPAYAEALAGMFHPRVAAAVLRSAGIRPSLPATPEGVARALDRAKDFRLRVTGIGDARHAQVTRGGAAVGGFDPRTLESRAHSGLFACGEALDVDGPCGGYNLHWAWASGLVAGTSAARGEHLQPSALNS